MKKQFFIYLIIITAVVTGFLLYKKGVFLNEIKLDKMNLEYIKRENKDGNKKPPLLLLIHGYGSNEQDLFGFEPYLPKEFFVISVRAPKDMIMGGYSWYDIDFSNGEKFTNTEQAKHSVELISDFITDSCDKYNLDKENIWLMGFSQGAILSYAMAVKYPEKIKNIIAMSGYIEDDILQKSKGENNYKNIKIFASHGELDPIIPLELAEEIPSKLKEIGVAHEFRTYKNMRHEVSSECFRDILKFIDDNLK